MHLMIVEGDPVTQQEYRRHFPEHGLDIASFASDGQELLRIYSQMAHGIDLLVIPEVMPTMSGLEASHLILKSNPKAVIILLVSEAPDLKVLHNSGILGCVSRAIAVRDMAPHIFSCLTKVNGEIPMKFRRDGLEMFSKS